MAVMSEQATGSGGGAGCCYFLAAAIVELWGPRRFMVNRDFGSPATTSIGNMDLLSNAMNDSNGEGKAALGKGERLDGFGYEMDMKVNSFESKDKGVPSEVVREISALKELSHRNVVRLRGVYDDSDGFHLIFELRELDLDRSSILITSEINSMKQIPGIVHGDFKLFERYGDVLHRVCHATLIYLAATFPGVADHCHPRCNSELASYTEHVIPCEVKIHYKVVSAATWVLVLPVTYAYTWNHNPPGFAQTIKSWAGHNSIAPSLKRDKKDSSSCF
ncbi:callose synthase 3 [Phtheirospermum japonicum]|uniref:Callose synthase 3 n=1 Tax=Phtheirospermum japonicum TaxID=374723 RepID=A0A830BEF7_9LAMI|nr:callose synthase 3 [Phtheirospermum japonicum]